MPHLASRLLLLALAASCSVIRAQSAEESPSYSEQILAAVSAQEVPAWTTDAAYLACSPDAISEAYEIVNVISGDIYIQGGSDPMTAEEFESYPQKLPEGPFIKNSGIRYLQFQGSCQWRSPTAPVNCTDDCVETLDYLNATWVLFSLKGCQGSYPVPGLVNTTDVTPPPGNITLIMTEQCKAEAFEPGVAPWNYMITDEWGNTYVMHAAGSNLTTPEEYEEWMSGLELPPGWTVETLELGETWYLLPLLYGDSCLYPLLRDNLNNGWQQIGYNGTSQLTEYIDECSGSAATMSSMPSIAVSEAG